jgi:hypothetical protein
MQLFLLPAKSTSLSEHVVVAMTSPHTQFPSSSVVKLMHASIGPEVECEIRVAVCPDPHCVGAMPHVSLTVRSTGTVPCTFPFFARTTAETVAAVESDALFVAWGQLPELDTHAQF